MPTPVVNKAADKIFLSTAASNIAILIKPMTTSVSGALGKIYSPSLNLHDEIQQQYFKKLLMDIKSPKNLFLKNIPKETVKGAVENLLTNLQPLNPDALSFQPSSENSFLFSFLKGDKKFYLEYFFNTKGILHQTVLNGFEKKKLILNSAGTVGDAILNFYATFDKPIHSIKKPIQTNGFSLSNYSTTEPELKTHSVQIG